MLDIMEGEYVFAEARVGAKLRIVSLSMKFLSNLDLFSIVYFDLSRKLHVFT
jgi:hypothetical protein